jgi:UDP-glucose 4-epimerase
MGGGLDGCAVLVTGGAGYIGSHVVLALMEAGARPVVLDDLSTGRRFLVPEGVPFVEADVGDGAAVAKALAGHGCRAAMHFAGSIVVPESVERPLDYYRNNVAGSLSLLRCAVEAGLAGFVFSSTAAVYAGGGARPLREDDPVAPGNPYGRSKLMTEWMLRDASAAHGLRHAILRYFNVAGADPGLRSGQAGPNATHLLKRACQAATGQLGAIEVFGTDYDTPDGTAVRDYIHVSDLAAAHVAALGHLLAGNDLTLNCGYGHGASVTEVLDAVDRVTGGRLTRRLAPRRPGDAVSLVADSRRLRETLGWQPRHDGVDEIVRTALAWERKLGEREKTRRTFRPARTRLP